MSIANKPLAQGDDEAWRPRERPGLANFYRIFVADREVYFESALERALTGAVRAMTRWLRESDQAILPLRYETEISVFRHGFDMAVRVDVWVAVKDLTGIEFANVAALDATEEVGRDG